MRGAWRGAARSLRRPPRPGEQSRRCFVLIEALAGADTMRAMIRFGRRRHPAFWSRGRKFYRLLDQPASPSISEPCRPRPRARRAARPAAAIVEQPVEHLHFATTLPVKELVREFLALREGEDYQLVPGPGEAAGQRTGGWLISRPFRSDRGRRLADRRSHNRRPRPRRHRRVQGALRLRAASHGARAARRARH